MIRHHYLAIPLPTVIAVCKPLDPTMPDSYLASDYLMDAVMDAFHKGYRWIRTDGEWAIFERTFKPLSAGHHPENEVYHNRPSFIP